MRLPDADSWSERTSHSGLLGNASAVAWAKHDPSRPSDGRIPGWRHSVVNAFAVEVEPLSV